jgi:hypothetical protein
MAAFDPPLDMISPIAIKLATGIAKAVMPKSPNITSLIALPNAPHTLKLHINKKIANTKKQIKDISLLTAKSKDSSLLVCFLRVDDFLLFELFVLDLPLFDAMLYLFHPNKIKFFHFLKVYHF